MLNLTHGPQNPHQNDKRSRLSLTALPLAQAGTGLTKVMTLDLRILYNGESETNENIHLPRTFRCLQKAPSVFLNEEH